MANNYGGNAGSGRGQQGHYDNVPPTQYLGNGGGYPQHASNNENDPYGESAYDDYDRPDSFDVSYYTRDGEYGDNIYMNNGSQGQGANDRPNLLSPDGPMPPGPMMGDLPPRRRRHGKN
ncbi:hypothetical protein GGI05_004294, partial [Coemansia sp. RSA 2603]